MKKMIINIQKNHEFRIAYLNNDILYNLELNSFNFIKKKLNIYQGKIVNIVPSLEAVFVDYGEKKYGFLPFKEIADNYFLENQNCSNILDIKNMLKKNQRVVVQIIREEMNEKCVKLTTFIKLSGSYLILILSNKKNIGISKKIQGKYRKKIKEDLLKFNIPNNISLIVRTCSLGQNIQKLKLDFLLLLNSFNKIFEISKNSLNPGIIFYKNKIIMRIFEDYLYYDIDKIIIDNIEMFNVIHFHIFYFKKFEIYKKIQLYSHTIPIFKYYNIDYQIDLIFQRKIRLPSGGSLVIDFTEAFTIIDINSSRSYVGKNIEDTALKTNLESIYEILRQLRLRDIGGLVLIDFINMKIMKNRRIIEDTLKKNILEDRAHIKIGRISDFGILELSRQKLNTHCNTKYDYLYPKYERNKLY